MRFPPRTLEISLWELEVGSWELSLRSSLQVIHQRIHLLLVQALEEVHFLVRKDHGFEQLAPDRLPSREVAAGRRPGAAEPVTRRAMRREQLARIRRRALVDTA